MSNKYAPYATESSFFSSVDYHSKKFAIDIPHKGGFQMAANDAKWEKLYEEAQEAGIKAGNAINPTPMHLVEHDNPLDDNSPIKNCWTVSEGACGFAWVVVKPGTCSFAKWLKKNDIGHKHYYGGWAIWVSDHGQSIMRKEAHAAAMAEVLRNYDINCYSESRLD